MSREPLPAAGRQPIGGYHPDNGTSVNYYLYRPGRGLAPAGPAVPGTAVAAADSWLVDNGRVRALDRHRGRFAHACAAVARPRGGPRPAEVAEFWDAAIALLPRVGRWFPRVQLSGSGRPDLWLLVRPAPRIASTVRLWLHDTADRRHAPRRKGPDLGWLMSLRSRAVAVGADDALLTTSGGLVLEGATTNLLWWESDCLCLPSPRLRTLPGVTSGLLVDRARETGVRVAYRRAAAADLANREVWAVNALHGIRPVIGWIGGPIQAGAPEKSPSWQRWLRDSAVPLP